MGEIIMITGGARSGKSAYALGMAEGKRAPRLYIATCPSSLDAEMQKRVEAHRRAREGKGFTTIEEPLDIARALKRAEGHGAVVVDCLTLWVNNLMHEAERENRNLTEDDARELARAAARACRKNGAPVIFVTNEVGMGVIPDNEAARRFVDLAGRVNQVIADEADEVILIASGIPMCVKRRQE